MVEIRRGFDGAERLPWLEPVEDEDGGDYYGEAPAGYGGVILAAIAVLIGIAIVTAAVALYRRHAAATADLGQIIRAPAGAYKVKPADPGGMKPDRNGEVADGTSAGQDIDSPLDLSALPEQPVAGRGAKTAPRAAPPAPPQTASAAIVAPPSAPTPVAKPEMAAPPKPAPVAPAKAAATTPEAAPAGPSATIQLGAFSAEAKANAAWKSLAARFAYIRGLEKVVAPVEADGRTLYRLRASGPAAAGLCARLKVAGETCAVVG